MVVFPSSFVQSERDDNNNISKRFIKGEEGDDADSDDKAGGCSSLLLRLPSDEFLSSSYSSSFSLSLKNESTNDDSLDYGYSEEDEEERECAAGSDVSNDSNKSEGGSSSSSSYEHRYDEEYDRHTDITGESCKGTAKAPVSNRLCRFQESVLNDFEMDEIQDYEELYFAGHAPAKINPDHSLPNSGYDDERGDYKSMVGDHLGYRYELTGPLGQGSFGVVFRCWDHCKNQPVAVKIIRNRVRFHAQAKIEVDILQTLNGAYSPVIIRILDHFYFRNHKCIVFPLMGQNLYEYLARGGFQPVSTKLLRRFSAQILQCLCLLVDKDVIHGDIKPENILLTLPTGSDDDDGDARGCCGGDVDGDGSGGAFNDRVCVIDFGSASYTSDRAVQPYLQSRYYRSPEIIVGAPYGPEIDMWSFGCLVAELFTTRPLFAGEDERCQLLAIMELMGELPSELMTSCRQNKYRFFNLSDGQMKYETSAGKLITCGSVSLADAVGSDDEEFLSFLKGCLNLDAQQRLTPWQALNHPWISASR